MLFMTACGDSSTAEDSKTVESAAESASDSSERESDSKPSGDWNAELITTGTETKKTDSTTAKGSDSETGATTTTKTTAKAVETTTQKPATTTKTTTTQKPVTQPNGSHTHNWVKYREADGIKYYQCNICGELKEEGKKTTTPTPTPTSKPSHTHNWKPVYYTKYACYQATTDGNSFVSKTYYFRNENGDCASKQDLINYEKACIECEDYIGSPQNKTASTYAEIRKPFGPSNEVAFYYCVNGSNIEVKVFNEICNYATSSIPSVVKNGSVWVKGTIFEKM